MDQLGVLVSAADEMIPWFVWRDEQQHSGSTGESAMESTADYKIINTTAVVDDLPFIVSNPSSVLLDAQEDTDFVPLNPSCEKSRGGGGGGEDHSPPSTVALLTQPTHIMCTTALQEPSWLSTEDKMKHLTPSELHVLLDSDQNSHPSPFALFGKDFTSSSTSSSSSSGPHLPPSGASTAGDTPWAKVISPNGSSCWRGMNNHVSLHQEPTAVTNNGNNAKALREIIYREAVKQPVNLGPETVWDRPRRKKVKLSDDPQTAAARRRRERISDRLWVLKRLVPGGNNMDTATMLDEACNYLRFLQYQLSSAHNSSGRNV